MGSFYYVISARQVKRAEFEAEPGRIRYLKVPENEVPAPRHEISMKQWIPEVQDLADSRADQHISEGGDVLIFIHGYNNDAEIIRQRQLQLSKDLAAELWRGVVVSFDWPCDNSTLNYVEDRSEATEVARQLVTRCISPLAEGQRCGCVTNVHLIGHSTGAYVISEAFTQAEKNGRLFKSDWRIAQVVLIGGDISSDSLAVDAQRSDSFFRRIMRLTNYQNPYDYVLAVSNAKRLGGTSPRVGRVGLPENAHPKAVNVNCGEYFQALDPKASTFFGTFAHSWHIGNRVFARDLAMTLEGRIDRNSLPTRKTVARELLLQDKPRPQHYDTWSMDYNYA